MAPSWRRWTVSVARASSDSEWSPSRLGSAETATAVPAGTLRVHFHIGPAPGRIRLPLGPALVSAILRVVLLAIVVFSATMESDTPTTPAHLALACASAAPSRRGGGSGVGRRATHAQRLRLSVRVLHPPGRRENSGAVGWKGHPGPAAGRDLRDPA